MLYEVLKVFFLEEGEGVLYIDLQYFICFLGHGPLHLLSSFWKKKCFMLSACDSLQSNQMSNQSKKPSIEERLQRTKGKLIMLAKSLNIIDY